MSRGQSRRPTAVVAAILTVLAAGAAPAAARISPTPKRTAATDLARAMTQNRSHVQRAIFSIIPPQGNPAAVSTTALADFPRHGRSFVMLSSGNTLFADDRNRSASRSAANLGPLVRGGRDVVIMRIYLRVPASATCLSFRFRFLTEEFPEFVDDIFNDAFIAELDDSTWDASGPADPTISAPRNFAVDGQGRPIRVNSVGDTSVSSREARGTTYDGATRILRASAPVTRRRHSLYLSIFDQGDRAYDSAVFIDRLTLDRRRPCEAGVVPD